MARTYGGGVEVALGMTRPFLLDPHTNQVVSTYAWRWKTQMSMYLWGLEDVEDWLVGVIFQFVRYYDFCYGDTNRSPFTVGIKKTLPWRYPYNNCLGLPSDGPLLMLVCLSGAHYWFISCCGCWSCSLNERWIQSRGSREDTGGYPPLFGQSVLSVVLLSPWICDVYLFVAYQIFYHRFLCEISVDYSKDVSYCDLLYLRNSWMCFYRRHLL